MPPSSGPMKEEVIALRIEPQPPGFAVTLRIGGAAHPPGRFDVDMGSDSRILAVVREVEYEQKCAPDTLADIGATLWAGTLRPAQMAAVRETVQDADHVTLELHVPEELDRLPWEALYDSQLRYLGCHAKLSVIHVSGARSKAAAPRAADRISILVVIPQGADLDVGTEWKNLTTAVAKLGADAVRLVDLRGVVHPRRLREALESERWNIVHFVGHGQLVENHVEIRMNDESGAEAWRTADQFAALFQRAGVDVCVLNCCLGGASANVRTMHRLAPALLATGVRGVVAMRYALSDPNAILFSSTFYTELLRGDLPGRVGYAAQLARKALFESALRDEHRAFVTPLVHTAGPEQRLFDLRPLAPRPSRLPPSNQRIVPPRLLEAIAERRCVVVVGHDLVPSPLDRRGPAAPGSLRTLVERLAHAVEGPDAAVDPATGPSAALASMPADVLLRQIAERFSASDRWQELVERVRDHYAPQEPTEAHRLLASWLPPGLFYTHFDGLMDGVHSRLDSVTVVRNVTDGVGPADAVLVLVRGSVADVDSLVLSENDHYDLALRIEQLHPSLAGLAKPRANKLRSVLFLGTNPADMLARQLARKLLGGQRFVPENYFVSDRHDPDDEWFWKGRFRTQFMRVDAATFIRAATPTRGGR